MMEPLSDKDLLTHNAWIPFLFQRYNWEVHVPTAKSKQHYLPRFLIIKKNKPLIGLYYLQLSA